MKDKDLPACFGYYVNLTWLGNIVPNLLIQVANERFNSLRNPFKHRRRKIILKQLPDIITEINVLQNVILNDLCSVGKMSEEKSLAYSREVYDLWNKHIQTVKDTLAFIGKDWLVLLDQTHGLIADWDKLPFEEGYRHAQ